MVNVLAFLEAIASLGVTFSLTHSLTHSLSQSGFTKLTQYILITYQSLLHLLHSTNIRLSYLVLSVPTKTYHVLLSYSAIPSYYALQNPPSSSQTITSSYIIISVQRFCCFRGSALGPEGPLRTKYTKFLNWSSFDIYFINSLTPSIDKSWLILVKSRQFWSY